MVSDGNAIEVLVSGMVCDDEEEAVKVSPRAAHYFSTLTICGKALLVTGVTLS
jgi:hypothetical protein